MLKIRPEQMEAFEQAALKRFEDEMLGHIKKYFPNHWRGVGETQLRKVIQYAAKQAKQYGLTAQREVCLYLNLMLLLGSDFDTDIQLPWVRKVLKDEAIIDPYVRIEQLYDVAMEHLDQVAGIQGEHLERVIMKVRSKLSEWMLLIDPVFESDLLSLLNWLYPQKIQEMGEENTLPQLIKQGTTSTQVHGIATQGGVILYMSLMLILGSHFDKDPKYPELATILGDASLTHELKIKVFYAEVSHQLDKFFGRGDE